MLAPHAPAVSFVPGQAGRLRVEASGPDYTPVVLLHGNGGNLTHWARTVPHLMRNHRTVAFDLRGMGESEAPMNGSYALDDMVEDVVEVAASQGLSRFVLVGHSFGASVVAACCRRIPQRLLGAVFVDGVGDLRRLPKAELDKWRASMAPERFRDSVQEWFVQLLAPATPETRVQVLQTLSQTPREAYVGAMEQLMDFDPAAAISAFGGPKALLSVRALDGPFSLRLAVPQLPCEFFDDVSHWLQLDRPDLTNAALDRFLARVA